MNFVAIDFETATPKRNSACAVGIVVVKNGLIINEFYSLIRPPNNVYSQICVRIHGITPDDTKHSPTFDEVYPMIKTLLHDQTIVAHNESFDRSVLKQTANLYAIDTSDMMLAKKWKCTMKIYKNNGFKSPKLNICCDRYKIPLNHHEALSDARGCALLYINYLSNLIFVYPETLKNTTWLQKVVSYMHNRNI